MLTRLQLAGIPSVRIQQLRLQPMVPNLLQPGLQWIISLTYYITLCKCLEQGQVPLAGPSWMFGDNLPQCSEQLSYPKY
jgi:hypothetical protein